MDRGTYNFGNGEVGSGSDGNGGGNRGSGNRGGGGRGNYQHQQQQGQYQVGGGGDNSGRGWVGSEPAAYMGGDLIQGQNRGGQSRGYRPSQGQSGGYNPVQGQGGVGVRGGNYQQYYQQGEYEGGVGDNSGRGRVPSEPAAQMYGDPVQGQNRGGQIPDYRLVQVQAVGSKRLEFRECIVDLETGGGGGGAGVGGGREALGNPWTWGPPYHSESLLPGIDSSDSDLSVGIYRF